MGVNWKPNESLQLQILWKRVATENGIIKCYNIAKKKLSSKYILIFQYSSAGCHLFKIF